MLKKALPFIFIVLACVSIYLPAHAKELDVQNELAYRVEFGNTDDIQMLLSKGGNPNGVNDLGWPLVSIAARRTDGLSVDIVDLLVKAGADINQGGPSRQFPIIIAARNGDVDLAEYLLAQGADSSVRDRNGVEPAEIAKYYGHMEVFDILEELALKRAEMEEKRRSPERLKELRHKLIANACASQYMTYYFKSGMDKDRYSQEEMDEELETLHSEMTKIVTDLYQIFKVPMSDIDIMSNYGTEKIFQELEEMISPRNRRRLGVGKPEDRTRRCAKIADTWMAAYEKTLETQKEKKELQERNSGGTYVR